MLLCLLRGGGGGGTYPFSLGWGDTPSSPVPGGQGVPHPRSRLEEGGYPIPGIGKGGTPSQVQERGAPIPGLNKGYPSIQTWNGVPPSSDLEWGTSHLDLGWGIPSHLEGVPPVSWMGYLPLSGPWMGYLPWMGPPSHLDLVAPHQLDGEPPYLDLGWGTPWSARWGISPPGPGMVPPPMG